MAVDGYVKVNLVLLCNWWYFNKRSVKILIIFQQDANYSVYFISVGSSTRFGCWHPSSGARTNVNTASGID
jgi:hypothetical protein